MTFTITVSSAAISWRNTAWTLEEERKMEVSTFWAFYWSVLPVSPKGKPASSSLVESENVENEYLNNMGPLHPSDAISHPFKSVVFMAIAATHNRGCWFSLQPKERTLISTSTTVELMQYTVEQIHSTWAAQRVPDLIRHVAVVLTWIGTDLCPGDGLTVFTFWISLFSRTLLYCCFAA